MANIYDMTDVWNDGATTFTSIKMNATDTASAADSKLLDLQVGSSSKVSVDKAGKITATDLQVDNVNVNSNTISSTTGNLVLDPYSGAKISLDGLLWPNADGSANQVLTTDGAGNLSWGTPAAGYSDSDVDTHLNTGSATSGQTLQWNGSDYAWGTPASSYGDSDVNAHLNQSSATNGQLLSWNGSDYAWITSSSSGGSYADTDVDAHLNQSSATSGQVLSWNGSDYAWVANSGGGGGLADVVDDTTPQLGGNLDLNSNSVTGTGNINITGTITTTSGGSVVPFYFANQAAFPSATTYHGAVAHSHADGAMYFAHGGSWNKLADTTAATTSVAGLMAAADKTKLDGVEASADVTDTANVTAAGAVMDTELADEAAVKAINQGLTTTSDVAFNDLVLAGDLTVNGTNNIIDTTNLAVTDSIIELSNGLTTAPVNDAGIVIERGTADNAFIGWDESEDKFVLGTGSFTGSSSGNLTITKGDVALGTLTTVTGDHAGGTTSVDVRKANAKYSSASVDAEPGASLINLDGAALTLTLGSDLTIGDIVTVYANPSTTGDVTITSGSGGPNLRINGETSNAAGDVTVADGTLAVITMVSNSIAVISGSDVS